MSRVEMPPCSISWPAKMNNGIAISVVESVPGRRLDDQHVGRQAEIQAASRATPRTARTRPTRRARAAPRTHRTGSRAPSVATSRTQRERARARTSTNSAPPTTNGSEIQPGRQRRARRLERPGREHQARAPAREHDADARPSRAAPNALEQRRADAGRPLARRAAKRKCVSWRTPTAAASISANFSNSSATGSVQAAGESST